MTCNITIIFIFESHSAKKQLQHRKILKMFKIFDLGVKFILINVEDGSLFPSCLVTCLLLLSCLFFLASVCVLSSSGIPFMFSQMIVACGLMQVLKFVETQTKEMNLFFFFVWTFTHLSFHLLTPFLSMRIRSQFQPIFEASKVPSPTRPFSDDVPLVL